MTRLLIANRGEVAVRIARTAADLGIEAVGAFSQRDARLRDLYPVAELVPLEGDGVAAYLDIEQWVGIARRLRCDLVHPGYGFLSENADFQRAVTAASSVFVGPSAAALRLFGDKAATRKLAQHLGIQTVAGTKPAADTASIRELLASLPAGGGVMLKAVSGGGGRGLRVVRAEGELEAAFERCRSEAERAFGRGEIFAERLVERARHVEIQIVADSAGAVSHLWERECSVQRRHQKLVEIAPAPNLDAALRHSLVDASKRLAAEASYCGLGTFEFLVDDDGEAFFLEANPRLQVEHTITEQITGLDLVEVQLKLATGAKLEELGLSEPPPIRGHALQVRIYAEKIADNGEVTPSSGEVTELRWPTGPGVRIDTAIDVGVSVDPAFDGLLAKLVVSHGSADLGRTLERARRALEELRLIGPATNIAFQRAVLERQELAAGRLHTGFLAEHGERLLQVAATFEAPVPLLEVPAGDVESIAVPGQEVLRAPITGSVLELRVAVGQEFRAGELLCVLEAMKMEHVVQSSRQGTVLRVAVATGQVVEEGAVLFVLAVSGVAEQSPEELATLDLEAPRADLVEVLTRHDSLLDSGRPEAVQRRRARGQRTARENLEDLCDNGSLKEYGALAVAAQRGVRSAEELRRKTPADGIVTGLASVNADLFGDRARCAVLAVDATVMAGTQGFFHHQKIDRMLEVAEKLRLPVIFFPEGGGGRPNDTDVSQLMTAGLGVGSFRAFARLAGRVPRISVVSGYCFAGSAAFAGCSDVLIATRDASLGMGGPAMIEGGGLGSFTPAEVGPAPLLATRGVVDLLAADEAEGTAMARQYLSYFQGDLSTWSCEDQRRLRHAVPPERRRAYSMRQLIEILCDHHSMLELRRPYGRAMITALVRIEGKAFGLIANDPGILGGAIDSDAAQKAARFLRLCEVFRLPVLSLCDTPGFMVGPEVEAQGHVRKASRLFLTGAGLSVPFFTVVVRKGYGLGAQAMAAGSFKAPVFVIAWPTGEIGAMGLEGAVRLGFKKQLEACDDNESRERLFEQLVGEMYQRGKALEAASMLELDAVVDPAETRAWLLRGLASSADWRETSGRFLLDSW